jgi:hypothetical protein
MNKEDIIKELQTNKEVYVKITTNSLEPKIRLNQKVKLISCTLDEVSENDMVLYKSDKSYKYGFVGNKNAARGAQIKDGKSFVIGWTKKIYAKIEI